jgi:hypothetical protein
MESSPSFKILSGSFFTLIKLLKLFSQHLPITQLMQSPPVPSKPSPAFPTTFPTFFPNSNLNNFFIFLPIITI